MVGKDKQVQCPQVPKILNQWSDPKQDCSPCLNTEIVFEGQCGYGMLWVSSHQTSWSRLIFIPPTYDN